MILDEIIPLKDGFFLSAPREADEAAYVQHLNDRTIYEQTLRIPYPYTEADARAWVKSVAEEAARQGRPVNWAIRREDGFLVGGIGFNEIELGKCHRAELGYWVARPYWGRGVATAAIGSVCQKAFAEFGLARVTACVFRFNAASCRVLEKCGFEREGLLRKHYRKDGKFLDGFIYAKLA